MLEMHRILYAAEDTRKHPALLLGQARRQPVCLSVAGVSPETISLTLPETISLTLPETISLTLPETISLF